jgi:hypothetical protein
MGVETADIPDSKNIAHYQFKLQGKTDADVSLANLSNHPTTLGNLIENAETGESIPTIKRLHNEPQNIETARTKFLNMFRQKIDKKELSLTEAVQGIESVGKTYATIEPIRNQRKSIKLKPVKPITPPPPPAPVSTQVGHSSPSSTNRSPEMIPITDETPTRAKSPLKSQKKIAKLDIDADDSMIDRILGQLDRDTNVNKLIKSGGIDSKGILVDLEKADPKSAITMIKKLTVDSMKQLLKNKNVNTKGLKLKTQYYDALLEELGLENPEKGSVMEKVGRIETKIDKRKK